MKHALVDINDKVANIIELEEGVKYTPSEGFRLIQDKRGQADFGKSYNTETRRFE